MDSALRATRNRRHHPTARALRALAFAALVAALIAVSHARFAAADEPEPEPPESEAALIEEQQTKFSGKFDKTMTKFSGKFTASVPNRLGPAPAGTRIQM